MSGAHDRDKKIYSTDEVFQSKFPSGCNFSAIRSVKSLNRFKENRVGRIGRETSLRKYACLISRSRYCYHSVPTSVNWFEDARWCEQRSLDSIYVTRCFVDIYSFFGEIPRMWKLSFLLSKQSKARASIRVFERLYDEQSLRHITGDNWNLDRTNSDIVKETWDLVRCNEDRLFKPVVNDSCHWCCHYRLN